MRSRIPLPRKALTLATQGSLAAPVWNMLTLYSTAFTKRWRPSLDLEPDLEPVSGFEPLTCRLQDGCSAN
jgi:hypothetical protein